MCRGCFSQLILRDEFHSGGIAGLLGKAAGMPTRRAFMAYSVAAASALTGVGTAPLSQRTKAPTSFCAAGRSVRCRARRSPRRSRSRAARCLRSATRARCRASRPATTKVVDLDGRTLLPGLIDPHCHTISASLISELLDDVGYAKYPTRESLVAHLKQEAASTPKGQWIVGANFDNLLQGGDFTKAELDGNLVRSPDLHLVHQRA